MTQSATAWSWVQYGCAEIINDARTIAYHRWACQNALYECSVQPQLLRDDCFCAADGEPADYTDPITDDVCWYDPQIPESAEFLGVLVRDRVAGARDSRFNRGSADSVGEGTVLQRANLRGGSFGFEVIILGTSCAGVEYGIEWLTRHLELAGCDSGDGCEACRTRCLTARVYCDDGAVQDNGLREWIDVGLIDGLAEVQSGNLDRNCCCVRAYTFTMMSQSPYSFTLPDELQTIEADEDAFDTCYDWQLGCVSCRNEDCIECQGCGSVLDSCELCREKCGPCDRCGFDPVCGLQAVRPIAPMLIDGDECVVCEPLNKVIQCHEYTNIDEQVDSTFVLDLFSGYDLDNAIFQERGLRNAAIKIHLNPQGLPPITDEDSYQDWLRREPCAELRVRYIPQNAVVRIDGRSQRVMLLCDKTCRPFEQAVIGPSTAAIFPILAACYNLLICIEWDSYQTQFRSDGVIAKPSRLEIQRYRRWRV